MGAPADELSRAHLIEEVLGDFDRRHVGLAGVKRRIRELACLFEVDRLRAASGLTSTRPSLHMCFTGNPGTGKTMVAGCMGNLLRKLGYLERGHVVLASRENLIGQHVGHTAPRAHAVVRSALGGVLFIDEAYAIHRDGSDRDFGHEVIEVLLETMEQHRDNLAVVLAGYPDRMRAFFQHNPGLASRVPHHIHFSDYDIDELMQISVLMLDDMSYRFSPGAVRAASRYLTDAAIEPGFGNGRAVRNMIEFARLRHAERVLRLRSPSRTQLLTLEAVDVPGRPQPGNIPPDAH
jgi:probable Rubsico expression protein CbbX